MRRRELCRRPRDGCGFAAPEPAPTGKVLMVISGAEASVRDPLTRARRMDELTSSCIDAHVIDVPAVDTEEDEIPRGQLVRGNGSRGTALCLGSARNLHTSLCIDVGRQPAAIKPFQIGATEFVGYADQLRGRASDIPSPILGALGDGPLIGLARNAAARCDNQQRRARKYIAQTLNLERRSALAC